MKAKLFLLLALGSICVSSYATHYRGGYITYKLLDAPTLYFEITVTTYSKVSAPSNLADKQVVLVTWGDGTDDTLCRVNGLFTNGPCYDGENCGNDLRKSVYTGTHHYAGLPAPPANYYIIGMEDLNRIANIININNGLSDEVAWYVEDTLFINNIISAGVNSSPVFLEECPSGFANLGDTLTINPTVYDADGDSLYFELAVPLQAQGSAAPLYTYPNQYCQQQGVNSQLYEIDYQTGQITWQMPCATGVFNAAYLVKEYRCGALLGTILRDVQIIVLNEPNDPPSLTLVTDTIIKPGDSISFLINATDPNASQTVSLSMYAGDVLSAQLATFTSTVGNPASAVFTWQTNAASVQKAAYLFTVAAADNHVIPGNPSIAAALTTYQTFRVWVTDSSECAVFTTTDKIAEETAISIYPNPFSNEINIGNLETGSLLRLTDLAGRILNEQTFQFSGLAKIPTDNIACGLYFLEMNTSHGRVVRQVVKQ